jgi:hypothetical protein
MYPERYFAEPTRRTPLVILEPGKISIFGRSIPENPAVYYGPVLEWISAWSGDNPENTKVCLGFEYINTVSTKWIFLILKELAELKSFSGKLSADWYYEEGDDDMLELGMILRSLIEFPFTINEVSDLSQSGYEKILTEKPLA